MNQDWIRFNEHYIRISAITSVGFIEVERGYVIDICANHNNFNKFFKEIKEAQKIYDGICITLGIEFIEFKVKKMSGVN
jgi:histidinol phosphatase-like PHP family hydrolase